MSLSLSRDQALRKFLPCSHPHTGRGVWGWRGATHLESVPFLPPPGPGCCHHSQWAPWSTWTTAASAPSLSRKAPGPYSDLQDPIRSSPSPCSSPTDPTSLLPPGLCPAGSLCPNALLPWLSGSQVGTVVPPRGHLAMSGDILGYNWYGGVAIGTKWVETRCVAKPPPLLGTAPQTKVPNKQHVEAENPALVSSSPGREPS